MKGLILAGGSGSRLYPATLPVCKQLLPIYDKPMIYYPLSLMMLAGIRDILLVVRPQDHSLFIDTLGDGSQWGISLSYVHQEQPTGIPEVYVLAEDFLEQQSSLLILGDNFLYAQNLQALFLDAINSHDGGTIFSYTVQDPERYGVILRDEQGELVDVVEKPYQTESTQAIPGIYLFDHQAIEVAKNLTTSHRGETEITDLIRHYLKKDHLKVIPLGRGTVWFDSGTPEHLLQASQFVHMLQARQGVLIACLEEIAFRMGYVTKEEIVNSLRHHQVPYSIQLMRSLDRHD